MELLEELREDFLICNICFEEYTNPKQLPCLHTFCKECLCKYICGKVVETGAEWFPCPFCRKAIQPTQGGGVRTWADSFPTNFLLSQLSSKLQDKTALFFTGLDDVITDRDISNRERCTDHPQSFLVGYCTRRRCAVCEECCVQKHSDCIRSHVRERDSRAMAEERRAECQEHLGALQIKLEGVKDTLTSREMDLTNRTEQLQMQTSAVFEDIKVKVDLFLAEQKRHLTAQLDNLIAKEKTRMQSVRQQVTEVSEANTRVCKRMETVGGDDLGIRDLATLDKAHNELLTQDQTVDRLRKDCVLTDMLFQPGTESVEQALKILTLGQVLSGPEARALACGGARPRVPRYSSGPATSPADYRAGEARSANYESEWHFPHTRSRALSPPGGAASSNLSTSPTSTAAGPGAYHDDDDVFKDRPRRLSEGQALHKDKQSKKPVKHSPTTPDFGAVYIEESRRSRSRSVPRRARPASEGAAVLGRQSRKRGVAKALQDKRTASLLETEINGGVDEGVSEGGGGGGGGGATAVKSGLNMIVLERAPQVIYPCSSGRGRDRLYLPRGGTNPTNFERSISSPPMVNDNNHHSPHDSSDDDMVVVVEGGSSEGGGGGGEEHVARDRSMSDSDVGAVGGGQGPDTITSDLCDKGEEGQHKSRKIACVRHFQTTADGDVKMEPGLVGISPVCRNRVAVSDRWNKVVKLIDIAGRVLDVLAISGDAEPWDLALRRPGLLAVTYPKEQKIRMIDVTDGGTRLHYRSHFMTRDGYASIAQSDQASLIASVCPPFGSPKIHVIDYLGAVLKAIDCSTVAYPRCLDVCGEQQVVVSDWTHHNVKIFPKDGAAPKVTYSGVPGDARSQLKAPMGVAWDGRGHVVIVDGRTCKLHAVSTRTGACTAIFSLPQQTGVELKLVTFVDASPELCSSERALVLTTTTGAVQVYDLCPY